MVHGVQRKALIPGALGLPSKEIASLRTFFVCLLFACSGIVGCGADTSIGDVSEKGLCVVDTPIRRLTRLEYNNTIRDLLGDATNPADALPPGHSDQRVREVSDRKSRAQNRLPYSGSLRATVPPGRSPTFKAPGYGIQL